MTREDRATVLEHLARRERGEPHSISLLTMDVAAFLEAEAAALKGTKTSSAGRHTHRAEQSEQDTRAVPRTGERLCSYHYTRRALKRRSVYSVGIRRTTMRLSEAMRLGAMTTGQAFGTERETRTISRGHFLKEEATVDYACAIGAAYLAAGIKCRPILESEDGRDPNRGTQATHMAEVPLEWYRMLHMETSCPACDGETRRLGRLIPHLNDDHRWTREQIADFVEGVERSLYPADEAVRAQVGT